MVYGEYESLKQESCSNIWVPHKDWPEIIGCTLFGIALCIVSGFLFYFGIMNVINSGEWWKSFLYLLFGIPFGGFGIVSIIELFDYTIKTLIMNHHLRLYH